MKVYVDFNELDAEDLPSSISNNYNLQVRSINSGSDYKNVKLINLTDYTKQVRKEVCDEIKELTKQQTDFGMIDEKITLYKLFNILDKTKKVEGKWKD